jgi:hypothetical protein
MAFWKPKPDFTLGDLQAFVVRRKKERKILLYKRMVDAKGHEHFSHELEIDDLPRLRALLDTVYTSFQK